MCKVLDIMIVEAHAVTSQHGNANMTQDEFNARADRYFNYAIVIVLIAFLKMFIEGIPQ